MNRRVRTKLDQDYRDQDITPRQYGLQQTTSYKCISCQKAGGTVIVKREKKKKGQTPYELYV